MFRWHKTFLLDNGWCQGNLSFPGFGIFYDQKPFGLSDLEKGQFPLGQLVVSRSCWPDLQMVGFGWPMYLTWSHGVRRTFFCLNRLEKKIHLDSSVDSLRVIRLVFAIYFEWMGTVDVYRHFFFRRHETICAFAGQGVLCSERCIWGCRDAVSKFQPITHTCIFFIDKVQETHVFERIATLFQPIYWITGFATWSSWNVWEILHVVFHSFPMKSAIKTKPWMGSLGGSWPARGRHVAWRFGGKIFQESQDMGVK